MDERHLRAERRPRLGHLDADHAATEDGEPCGSARRGCRLDVRPGPRFGQTGNRRHQRRRPGGDHDCAPRDERRRRRRALAATPSSRPRPRTISTPRCSSHGTCPESSRCAITSSRRVSTAVQVQIPDRHTRHPSCLVGQLDRSQQRLRRHAGVVRALASDQPVLDDRDGQPALAEPARADLTGQLRHRSRPHRTRARSRPHLSSTAQRLTRRTSRRDRYARCGTRSRPRSRSPPGRATRTSEYAVPDGSSAGTPTPSSRAATSRAATMRAVPAQLDTQDGRRRERAAHHERAVAAEVPERVGDQLAAVPLHPAQHVRARADDEIGPRIDDRVRERERVAAVLTEEHLGAGDDVLVRDAFGAGVHRHDDDVGAAASHAPRAAWRRRCRSGSVPTGTARSRAARPGCRGRSGS